MLDDQFPCGLSKPLVYITREKWLGIFGYHGAEDIDDPFHSLYEEHCIEHQIPLYE